MDTGNSRKRHNIEKSGVVGHLDLTGGRWPEENILLYSVGNGTDSWSQHTFNNTFTIFVAIFKQLSLHQWMLLGELISKYLEQRDYIKFCMNEQSNVCTKQCYINAWLHYSTSKFSYQTLANSSLFLRSIVLSAFNIRNNRRSTTNAAEWSSPWRFCRQTKFCIISSSQFSFSKKSNHPSL